MRPFDDNGSLAQRQSELVERAEVKRKLRLDLRATVAQIENRHRFVDGDLPGHLPRRRNALAVTRVGHRSLMPILALWVDLSDPDVLKIVPRLDTLRLSERGIIEYHPRLMLMDIR